MRFATRLASAWLCGISAAVSATMVGTVALVGAASVFSTVALAGPPATAPAAPTAPMAPRAPTASSPVEIARLPSLKSCNKAADAKSLTGKDRATFVKDCQAGKTPPQD